MLNNILRTVVIVGILFSSVYAGEITENFENYPVKGKVTMIDLGADKCIPCKMMAPILEKLSEKYKGHADILFVDVWKHRDQAGRFGLRAIPTQIFFDASGKEVFRHMGYFDEKSIKTQLEKMGVVLP